MKTLLIILTCFALETACTKSNNDMASVNNTTNSNRVNSDEGCISVTVTDSAPAGCHNWGIISKGQIYPSANIPEQFKQNGLVVCADYTTYEDMRLCPCCGGTWADIKSMELIR